MRVVFRCKMYLCFQCFPSFFLMYSVLPIILVIKKVKRVKMFQVLINGFNVNNLELLVAKLHSENDEKSKLCSFWSFLFIKSIVIVT